MLWVIVGLAVGVYLCAALGWVPREHAVTVALPLLVAAAARAVRDRGKRG